VLTPFVYPAAQQYIKERPHDHMRGRLCPYGRNFKIAEAVGKEACNGKVRARRPFLPLAPQCAAAAAAARSRSGSPR